MTTVQHTYLRYECADTFGLVFSSGSSKAPPSNEVVQCLGGGSNIGSPSASFLRHFLAATTGSSITIYNNKTSQPVWKVYHYEELTGGVGTGRALNSDEVVCFDTFATTTLDSQRQEQSLVRIASGWVDGAIRIWTITSQDLKRQRPHQVVHSLLHIDELEDGSEHREPPLVLNGHNQTPVRTLRFDPRGERLASGGSDGSVVLWDVVAETGLFRLLGHSGGITQVVFVELTGLDTLITSSLDGLIKVWDLGGQCCIQTIANHRGEVWAAAYSQLWMSPRENEDNTVPRKRLVTGGSDGQVRVWSLHTPKRIDPSLVSDSEDSSNQAMDDVCRFMGLLVTPPNVAVSAEKIQTLHFHPSGKYCGVMHGNSKNIDVYIVRSVRESHKKRQRRMKRREEKEKKKHKNTEQLGKKRGLLDDDVLSEDENEARLSEEQQLDPTVIKASDEFEYITTIRASHKVRAFTFGMDKEKGELTRIVCALTTNGYESYSISRVAETKGQLPTYVSNKVASMDAIGHPTGIRGVALSSDDNIACTVSKNMVKLWSIESRACVQTLTPGVAGDSKQVGAYGLCVVFLPGNSHVVVGTREGHLLVIDIAAGEVVFSVEKAHETAVWSIDVRKPTSMDGAITLITGGAKEVKFWEVESSEDAPDEDTIGFVAHPVLVQTRTLQMTDEVVAARFSNSSTKRMVCVATLDSTVKIFFEDSLKLFLSLYGHKLPVLALDCSDDDTLLVTASADKTIKIHGLDFGDTHRTLHGHEDSVTDVRFVRRTHNFFTTSKDGTVRYWDGDRFENILILAGHTAEVNGLVISRTGAFVLTCGMDRQVRVWERTKDIVFLEEERERALEQIFDRVGNRDEKGTAAILGRKLDEFGDEEENAAADDSEPQSETVVKRSVLSISAGDRLIEGLELADQELKEIALFRNNNQGTQKQRRPSPLLMGLEPAHYVLWILKSIKSAEMEQCLLLLPQTHVERLIYYCSVLLKQGRGVETCSRVAIFLVKVHQWQLVANKSTSVPLRELRHQLRRRLMESRDVIGYNLAAMKLIGRVAQESKPFFVGDEAEAKNIWAGLGLGSDVAAALDGRPNRR